ncbi:matrixin family metalloprotease [Bacillus sp. DNRA2]|uniref:matrixin family metalloprotease n=1 Tax=Bacillus sp. DNRA2 TaxID=2723053 RepID=UPI00145F6720|nr:matrixin family metalloprotease [Bacillus sp. DNRA2]NMD72845.1 matrixin family metalloprotease [Bacillus sp. DNRA2]
MSYVRTAASTWNAYKSGVIRPDSLTVVEDVYCSDYSESSGIDAYTTGGGAIWFNTRNLGSKGSAEKLNVATHELGHALGLGYNQTTDVMYMYTSTRTTLSANDKASYDAASILY